MTDLTQHGAMAAALKALEGVEPVDAPPDPPVGGFEVIGAMEVLGEFLRSGTPFPVDEATECMRNAALVDRVELDAIDTVTIPGSVWARATFTVGPVRLIVEAKYTLDGHLLEVPNMRPE